MKKRFYYILGEILFILTILLSINFFIDAYGIFGKNMKYQILEPNKNYLKTKYILKNKHKYDAFIFGSSRVGVIPVEKISGYRFYNMTYSEGLPKEWLKTINTFIENDVAINMIIIGIDDISFKVDDREHLNQPMRIPYQELSNKGILKNYLFVNPLNSYNFLTLKEIIKRNYSNDYSNIYKTGSNITEKTMSIEKEIEKNVKQHISKEIFLETSYGTKKFINIDKNVEILKNIENLCIKNGIEVIFIFNPLHSTAFINNNEKEYIAIKEKIFKVLKSDIYDFSSNNSISKNNYYWYETSHFRVIVGEMILKAIFKDKFKEGMKIDIPDDFIYYIKYK